jgi:peroxiredoxin
MKNLIIVLFLISTTSVFAQIDSIKIDSMKYEVFHAKGNSYVISADFGKGISTKAIFIKTDDKDELDSLDKKLVPYRFLKSFNAEALIKEENSQKIKQKEQLKVLLDSPVPDFDAKDTEGVLHRPHNYFGRVLVLHFWNFWDASFEQEIPFLNKIFETYQKDGLQILSFVDLELTKSEYEILEKKPIRFPLIQNSRKFMFDFLKVKHSIPYLIIVDKQGRMRYFYIDNELKRRDNPFYKKQDSDTKIDNFEEQIQKFLKGM